MQNILEYLHMRFHGQSATDFANKIYTIQEPIF